MAGSEPFCSLGSRSKDEIRDENFCDSEIYARERAELSARRREFGGGEADRFAGLAISGGGVRSATFALGLLQALARRDLLKGFDYLSTVSGGGYIGASLSWLTGKNYEAARKAIPGAFGPYGLGSGDFPYGTAPPKDRSQSAHWTGMLRFLRDHAEYLAPGPDIDLLSGIAVVLRGIILNLLVWIPIFTFLFLVLMTGFKWDTWIDLPTLLFGGQTATEASALENSPEIMDLLRPGFINLHELILILGLFFLIWFCAISLVFSAATFFIKRRTGGSGAADNWGARFSYAMRRRFDRWTKNLVPAGLLLVGVGILPYVAARSFEFIDSVGQAGAGALVSGLLSGLYAAKKSQNSMVQTLVLPAIAIVVLVGGLISTCCLAIIVREGGFFVTVSDLDEIELLKAGVGDKVFLGFLVLAIVSGYFVNANYISLHRFYRDRLMEAFMPMPEAVRENRIHKASGANEERLLDISAPETGAPYHLVNTNLILVESEDALYRRRGGDNFVFSRIYCGGDAGGYHPTALFSGGDMTLATAMTISGAAANPNSGWAGTGPTRLRSVSWLMSLLNIRLGYWVRNRHARKFLWYSDKPSHFDIMLSEIGLTPKREGGKWFQLSDGGHFENLAIYELIRRRCPLILVSDAGADPKFEFGDLQNSVRRVSQDFGVKIEFGRAFQDRDTYVKAHEKDGKPPELGERLTYDHYRNRVSSLVPQRKTGFPVDGKVADHGYIIGRITYPARGNAPQEEGVLIYVKAAMLDGLSLETRGYKTDHPDFPHQSTADQFFDPSQFEAYRELGNAIGEDMIEGAGLRQLLAQNWGTAADGG
ncbi:hypothetical protein NUH88_02635 [Nisaea acidiphila]|uniref:PNPLA domain-containing protein n=1 Tax=Nisaea acidiphila TaxID=1862145 RepID=A0A9J7AYU1_9PROT|nr:hypothetical protein [Nisaea acidiphila]UUX50597.1 hypothetical protein NUH88_02635 [Nisaea acidiphila]